MISTEAPKCEVKRPQSDVCVPHSQTSSGKLLKIPLVRNKQDLGTPRMRSKEKALFFVTQSPSCLAELSPCPGAAIETFKLTLN